MHMLLSLSIIVYFSTAIPTCTLPFNFKFILANTQSGGGTLESYCSDAHPYNDHYNVMHACIIIGNSLRKHLSNQLTTLKLLFMNISNTPCDLIQWYSSVYVCYCRTDKLCICHEYDST